MPGVLRSRPKFSKAELAIFEERTAARLANLFGHGDRSTEPPGQSAAARPPIVVEGASDLIGLAEDPDPGEALAVMESPSDTPELASAVETPTLDAEIAGVEEQSEAPGAVAADADIDAAVADDGEVSNPPAAEDPIGLAAEDPIGPAAGAVPGAPPTLDPGPVEHAATSGSSVTRRARGAPTTARRTETRPQEVRPKAAAAKALPAPAAPAKAVPAPAAPAPKSVPAGRAALKVAAVKPDRPARPAARRPPAADPARATARPGPVVIAALCPYCALFLQPPPSANRRCPRCRQAIVVKRTEGRTAYLTEAAVAIFEAERKKASDAALLTRERDKWLRLAIAAGAPAQKTGRMAAARLSGEVVEAARQLYLVAVERAFGSAKRDHRWEDASHVRREHAMALHRLAGSPLPAPADLLALYREGVAVQLRGLAEVVRDAQLVGATCCDACRADNGRIYAISKELSVPRLPHEGCPKALCRCTWDLATRDRDLVVRYLRRRPRAGARPATRD
jgi:hypothetical protein